MYATAVFNSASTYFVFSLKLLSLLNEFLFFLVSPVPCFIQDCSSFVCWKGGIIQPYSPIFVILGTTPVINLPGQSPRNKTKATFLPFTSDAGWFVSSYFWWSMNRSRIIVLSYFCQHKYYDLYYPISVAWLVVDTLFKFISLSPLVH